ncbi:NAD-dependent epimerase/dehydratase family protein [Dactylosporangium roseum]|uniref:NAD-dependent epimerase/dehydratase family protein n=1 Tax=Dactylosporangium roseum TaxID=47989 RepID=A0ABY5Z119_9ACTN|nr:NAD-dependent epimerase/dehydratase family protein [Dactylosporangium roseum]UWZ34473.1 NAD-dependent epimerase/dehydratase family protein [Dactylosporangium roseum]
MPKVLVAGATGLIGRQCIADFLAQGWDVVGISRRVPDLSPDPSLSLYSVDLTDRASVQTVAEELGTSDRIVYASVLELDGLVAGWRDQQQIQTNGTMFRNLLSAIPADNRIEHIALLQGTKAYGAHRHDIPIPARERAPRDDHENFYFLQEDMVRDYADRTGVAWSVLRPQCVWGEGSGVSLSIVPILGAYAALCRERKEPFTFPGGPSVIWEATDTRILAHAIRWSGDAPAARNEIFNVTNGDVFEWRSLWPVIADSFGVEVGEDNPRSMAEFFAENGDVWARLAARHELRQHDLAAIVGKSSQFADWAFAYGWEKARHRILSTTKIRAAGFDDFIDSEDSFRYWASSLIRDRWVPAPKYE